MTCKLTKAEQIALRKLCEAENKIPLNRSSGLRPDYHDYKLTRNSP